MHARLAQVEQQLLLSQQDSTGLPHQALDVRGLLQAAGGAQEISVSQVARAADGHGKQALAGDDQEKEELVRQLAQARGSIEDLSQQKAALEELVRELKRRAGAREQHAARLEPAASGDDDARVFGLQASVVALNASLVSYQQDLEELQYQLDDERSLSSDLEYVIRSALVEHGDLSDEQELAAVKLWSQDARLRFDNVLGDLRGGSRRSKHRARGKAAGVGRLDLESASSGRLRRDTGHQEVEGHERGTREGVGAGRGRGGGVGEGLARFGGDDSSPVCTCVCVCVCVCV